MSNGRADLHLHTTASDGAWSPTELVDMALSVGLKVIAVTDHDTLDGISEALARGAERGLEVIPGVELSVRGSDQEVHLLGYFIDTESKPLREALAKCQAERVGRVEGIVERLRALQYDITATEVMNVAQQGSAGRPHVARVLVEKGYVASVPEAFDRLLAEGRPAFVPRRRLTLADGINLIHAAGGVAVCAHPGLLKEDSILGELVELGLDGLEVVHSEHDHAAQARYDRLAEEHGLLKSGGSDCHGPGIKRALFIGQYSISLAWVDALRERSRERQLRYSQPTAER